MDASCASARSALAQNPRMAEAHWRLAITLKGRLPDSDVAVIERLAPDESLPDKARAFLYYGLAAVCDDRGDYSNKPLPTRKRPPLWIHDRWPNKDVNMIPMPILGLSIR